MGQESARYNRVHLLSCQVLQVSPVLRVLMAGPVVQASMEVPVDQENLADQEDQGCQATRVRQVGTGSRDRLESKETQVSHQSRNNDAVNPNLPKTHF